MPDTRPTAASSHLVDQPARVKRDPMPLPTDFGIEGPFPAPIEIPWWAALIGLALLFFVLGAVLRHTGVI
jgi:hypothetical protein